MRRNYWHPAHFQTKARSRLGRSARRLSHHWASSQSVHSPAVSFPPTFPLVFRTTFSHLRPAIELSISTLPIVNQPASLLVNIKFSDGTGSPNSFNRYKFDVFRLTG